MIIRMRNASKVLAERVAGHFLKQGLNVFVENVKGEISLAVFHSENDMDYFPTNGLIGIMSIREGNKYFIDNREKFVLAEICFV